MPNALISRLAIVFGTPSHTGDPVAYMAELDRITKRYTEPQLDRAADILIRDHRPTRLKPWPSPSTILEACEDAAGALTPQKDPSAKYKDWSPASVGKAYDLMRTDLGREAADQGWALSLWDFSRQHGRLPNEREVYDCKVRAREFDAAYASLTGDTPLSRMLQKLGGSMLARRNKLARHAWGEEVPRDEGTMT